jgi:hypothetical protein
MPARHIPPQPPRSEFEGQDLAAYDQVVKQQKSYNYDEFLKIIPAEHRHAVVALTGASATAQDAAEADRIQPYMGAMLNSPQPMRLISDLGAFFRARGQFPGTYTHADREWVDMVLAEELGAWGVYYTHMFDAVAVGVRIEAIRALREGRDEDLTAEEFVKAKYIRQVARGTVTPESYEKIEQLLGRRATVEFTGFIGFLIMTIRLIQTFGAHQERTEQMVSELIGKIERSEVPISDPHARAGRS